MAAWEGCAEPLSQATRAVKRVPTRPPALNRAGSRAPWTVRRWARNGRRGGQSVGLRCVSVRVQASLRWGAPVGCSFCLADAP